MGRAFQTIVAIKACRYLKGVLGKMVTLQLLKNIPMAEAMQKQKRLNISGLVNHHYCAAQWLVHSKKTHSANVRTLLLHICCTVYNTTQIAHFLLHLHAHG